MTEKKETRQMGRNNQEARVQAPTEENEGTVGNQKCKWEGVKGQEKCGHTELNCILLGRNMY